MCASSPGINVEPLHQGNLQVAALESSQNRKALETLQKVINSSLGPHGKIKMLHNDSGGHVTMTSSSGRLLQALSTHNPILRLIVSATQSHVNNYNDGGLLAAASSLNLILNSLQSDLHRHLLVDIFEFLLKECVNYLESDECECKVKLEITDLNQMKSIIKTVIGTKSGCGFTQKGVDHICSLVLLAVLRIVPAESSRQYGNLQYLAIEGLPVSESYLCDGILFATPQIPTYRQKPLDFKTKDIDGKQQISVALFNISLAGDTDEKAEAKYEIGNNLDVDEIVFEQMWKCIERVVELGVGLLVCQKVVHPGIHRRLRQQGVWVLDRLGSSYIRAAHALTGGTLLSSFSHPVRAEDLGHVSCVQHHILQDKSYLHLQVAGKPVCTLVLGNKTEEALAEMKHVCSNAEHVLRMALLYPSALTGGGCWQSHLVAYVKTQAEKHSESWITRLDCTHSQLFEALQIFTRSLEQVTMAIGSHGDHVTDDIGHHHWLLPPNTKLDSDWSNICQSCSCGMYQHSNKFGYFYIGKEDSFRLGTESQFRDKKQCKVLDFYPSMLNALRTGVSMGCMVLGIQHSIKDTN